MMPILVKSDDVRSERKVKARHRQLWAAHSGVNGLTSNISYSDKNNKLLNPNLYLNTVKDATFNTCLIYYRYSFSHI